MNKQDILKIVEDAMDRYLFVGIGRYTDTTVLGQKDCLEQIEEELDKLFNDNDLSKF